MCLSRRNEEHYSKACTSYCFENVIYVVHTCRYLNLSRRERVNIVLRVKVVQSAAQCLSDVSSVPGQSKYYYHVGLLL